MQKSNAEEIKVKLFTITNIIIKYQVLNKMFFCWILPQKTIFISIIYGNNMHDEWTRVRAGSKTLLLTVSGNSADILGLWHISGKRYHFISSYSNQGGQRWIYCVKIDLLYKLCTAPHMYRYINRKWFK